MDVDSDVNDDRNREHQLDESLEYWLESVENQIEQKEKMTNVPQENVFDVAENMDKDE